eukprot:g16634.t1
MSPPESASLAGNKSVLRNFKLRLFIPFVSFLELATCFTTVALYGKALVYFFHEKSGVASSDQWHLFLHTAVGLLVWGCMWRWVRSRWFGFGRGAGAGSMGEMATVGKGASVEKEIKAVKTSEPTPAAGHPEQLRQCAAGCCRPGAYRYCVDQGPQFSDLIEQKLPVDAEGNPDDFLRGDGKDKDKIEIEEEDTDVGDFLPRGTNRSGNSAVLCGGSPVIQFQRKDPDCPTSSNNGTIMANILRNDHPVTAHDTVSSTEFSETSDVQQTGKSRTYTKRQLSITKIEQEIRGVDPATEGVRVGWGHALVVCLSYWHRAYYMHCTVERICTTHWLRASGVDGFLYFLFGGQLFGFSIDDIDQYDWVVHALVSPLAGRLVAMVGETAFMWNCVIPCVCWGPWKHFMYYVLCALVGIAETVSNIGVVKRHYGFFLVENSIWTIVFSVIFLQVFKKRFFLCKVVTENMTLPITTTSTGSLPLNNAKKGNRAAVAPAPLSSDDDNEMVTDHETDTPRHLKNTTASRGPTLQRRPNANSAQQNLKENQATPATTTTAGASKLNQSSSTSSSSLTSTLLSPATNLKRNLKHLKTRVHAYRKNRVNTTTLRMLVITRFMALCTIGLFIAYELYFDLPMYFSLWDATLDAVNEHYHRLPSSNLMKKPDYDLRFYPEGLWHSAQCRTLVPNTSDEHWRPVMLWQAANYTLVPVVVVLLSMLTLDSNRVLLALDRRVFYSVTEDAGWITTTGEAVAHTKRCREGSRSARLAGAGCVHVTTGQ